MEDTRHCPNCFEVIATREATCPVCGYTNDGRHHSRFLPPGTLLVDRYLVGRVMGSGGFGVTYLVYDQQTGVKRVLKEYLPRDSAGRTLDGTSVRAEDDKQYTFEWGRERFLREATTLEEFEDHLGIVGSEGHFEANGTAYFLMPYVKGITLKTYVVERCGGKVSYAIAEAIMLRVMDALHAVHGAGILHRDVSPDNIFVTAESQIKLLDFGAARHGASALAETRSVIVKPGYAPEEQYHTHGKQGPWTDVYSTAATLYWMVTGNAPPEAPARLSEDRLVAPSALGVEIPAVAEAALLRALSVRAADRFQTIRDWQTLLLPSLDPAGARQLASGGPPFAAGPSSQLAPGHNATYATISGLTSILDSSAAVGQQRSQVVTPGAGEPASLLAGTVSAADPSVQVAADAAAGRYRAQEGVALGHLGRGWWAAGLGQPGAALRRLVPALRSPLGLVALTGLLLLGALASLYVVGTSAARTCGQGEVQACEQACRGGDGDSCKRLGPLHHYGSRAAAVWQPACKGRVASACGLLAQGRWLGDFEGWPLGSLASPLREACQSDDGLSCAVLGEMLLQGEGVGRDPAQASSLCGRGCRLGEARGCLCEAQAAVVTGRSAAAADLARRGAGMAKRQCAAGDGPACRLLTMGLPASGLSREQAHGQLRSACDSGYQGACVGLAEWLSAQADGDEGAIVELYERACEAHAPAGCEHLIQSETSAATMAPLVPTTSNSSPWSAGCNPETGDGCDAAGRRPTATGHGVLDVKPSAAELESACKAGHSRGCAALGQAYLSGDGVEQNAAQGIHLLEQACGANVSPACLQAAIVREQGDGVPVDLRRAFKLYGQACDAGNQDGCAHVGECIFYGVGTRAEQSRGRELLATACDRRSMYGCARLAALYELGSSVAVDDDRARALYDKACQGGYVHACNR